MASVDNWFLRPGTLFLMVFMLVIGFGVFNWASAIMFQGPVGDAGQQIECGAVDLEFVHQSSNSTHKTVYIRLNRRVEAVLVNFIGSENVTRIVSGPPRQKIQNVSAKLGNLSKVEARVKGCDQVFTD